MRTAVKQSIVHWEAANAAVTAAVCKANKPGIRLNAPVVDASGNLMASLHIPRGLACNLNYGGGLAWPKRAVALRRKTDPFGIGVLSSGIRVFALMKSFSIRHAW